MNWIVKNLWLIPALPMFAAGIGALLKQRSRIPAACLAIGSMVLSFLLSLAAFRSKKPVAHSCIADVRGGNRRSAEAAQPDPCCLPRDWVHGALLPALSRCLCACSRQSKRHRILQLQLVPVWQ